MKGFSPPSLSTFSMVFIVLFFHESFPSNSFTMVYVLHHHFNSLFPIWNNNNNNNNAFLSSDSTHVWLLGYQRCVFITLHKSLVTFKYRLWDMEVGILTSNIMKRKEVCVNYRYVWPAFTTILFYESSSYNRLSNFKST